MEATQRQRRTMRTRLRPVGRGYSVETSATRSSYFTRVADAGPPDVLRASALLGQYIERDKLFSHHLLFFRVDA